MASSWQVPKHHHRVNSMTYKLVSVKDAFYQFKPREEARSYEDWGHQCNGTNTDDSGRFLRKKIRSDSDCSDMSVDSTDSVDSSKSITSSEGTLRDTDGESSEENDGDYSFREKVQELREEFEQEIDDDWEFVDSEHNNPKEVEENADDDDNKKYDSVNEKQCDLGSNMNTTNTLKKVASWLTIPVNTPKDVGQNAEDDDDNKTYAKEHDDTTTKTLKKVASWMTTPEVFAGMDPGCHKVFGDQDEEDMDEESEMISTLISLGSFFTQLRETLEVLCSERLGQMTKTYNDIECVTRLLEEKERDLELAARIGQSLLEKNKNVEAKNDRLQAELDDALEKIRQLRHELVAKEALLHIYSQDEDSPSPVLECSGGLGNPLLANMELLQNKVKALEMENLQLTVDKTSLKTETLDLEQKEAGLMKDCVKQLSDANDVIHGLQEELALKAEDEAEKHLQIVFLQGKINTMEQERMSFAAEQAELQKHLGAAKEAQRELTSELGDLEQRYDECMALLVESQEDNKTLRKKSRPSAIHQHYGTTPFYMPEGSLAMELERSMHSEEEMPEGHKPQQRRSRNSRVMATARAVRLATSRTNSQASLHSLAHVDADASNRSSMYLSDADSYISDGGGGGDNSLSMLGRAGVPGSNDLETALRNLSMKKANDINDQQFLHDREDKKKAIPESDDGLSGFASGWTTPESYMSLGSGSTDLSRASSFRMPEKLQIVKPLAGSATLHQWQRLATNRDLHGLLEARPLGVQTKTDDPESGGAGEQEVYSLSDYEEDEEYCPNRADNEVSGTYTYTTSRIMHPTDHYLALNGAGSSSSKGTVLTTSVSTSQQSLSFPHSSSRQTSQQSGGTSTFSMSWGLAKELQERSISPRGLLANPPRFMAISSETRASDLGASHAQPAYSNASLFVSPICGVNTDSASGGTDASNSPMRYRPENAYLNLVDKIKDLGLTNIMDIAEGSSLIPRSQNNAVDVGLNSVTFMKRQSFFRFQRRAGKYVGPPSSVVVSDTQTISTTEQSSQTSLINQTSYSNQTISKNQDTGVTQSTERAYKISPPSSNAGFAELPSYMCPVPGSASIAIGRPGKTTYSSSSTTSQVVNGGGKSASLASLSSSLSTTTNGSVSSIPSLAELTNSSNSNSNNSMSRSNSAGRLSSILEAPSLEGIATRGTMGMVAVAGLKATPTFFQKKAAKKS